MSAGDTVPADDLDDYDTDGGGPVIADPFEGWNRFWFRFNDGFYVYVADPVYRGWKAVTPEIMRTGLQNFFHNALFPVRFVNSLLQFKFKAAGVEFSRFMLNTMCSAGFANPASKKKTIVPVDPAGEDFGQTLGVWGLGHGPYIVWPFLGPSSLRETVGRIGDLFADPLFYAQPWWAGTATAMTLRFNNLDSVLPLYLDLKGSALDPYIAMREAYINYRNLHVKQ
ncbi:MAG: VacJ family lipoprotein [Desulfovibrio sp.]|nr:VacJ family lipoprotein [Desulfovibrio sp.]